MMITLILYKWSIMCGLDSTGLGLSPLVGCSECDNESPSCANIRPFAPLVTSEEARAPQNLLDGCIVSKPIRKHCKTYWLRETDLCNLLMYVIESIIKISATSLLFAWFTYNSLHVCTTDSHHEWKNRLFNIIPHPIPVFFILLVCMEL